MTEAADGHAQYEFERKKAMTTSNILSVIASLIEVQKILPHLESAFRQENLLHARELAECRNALRAATELLQRKDAKIEQLTTQMLQLLDEINKPACLSACVHAQADAEHLPTHKQAGADRERP